MRLLYFVTLYLFITEVKSLHTVLCISGFGNQPLGLMKVRCNEIAKKYPGTKVEIISPGSVFASSRPEWTQINDHMDKVKKIARENPDGVNMVGYSLGGVHAKAYIELLSELKVVTFISVNSPIMGFYPHGPHSNLWSFLETLLYWRIAHPLIELIYPLFYGFDNKKLDDNWHDPRGQPEYQTDYLAWANNLNGSCSECKANFLKVGKVYLIGSNSDGVIVPWYSAHGGFFNKNFNVVPLEEQLMYRSNTLGWKTLASEGRLHQLTIPNAGHLNVILCKHLFEKYVTKYLQ